MKKRTIRLAVYGALVLFAVLFGAYYYTAGLRLMSVRYDFTPLYIHNFLTRPLFWWALGALAAEGFAWKGWLRLPRWLRRRSMLLAILLLALYVLLAALSIGFGAALPHPVPTLQIRVLLPLTEHPLLFLIPGLLWGAGFGAAREPGRA